ncbi:hypothetical protein [Acinetobacter nectaris]|nr:hypothetical protein [Acinetobacter nectaris]
MKLTAAVNICLIVPILIACAIFYNLRIAAWLVSLNGFYLFHMAL